MSKCNRERGAAAVEMALLLPVLAMILLAIMEFGYAFFIQASVAGAARVGIRDYVIHFTELDAKDTAVDMAKSGLPDPSSLVSATFSPDCVDGAQSTLIITYRYHSLTGLLDGILGSNVNVTGKGSMQCGG